MSSPLIEASSDPPSTVPTPSAFLWIGRGITAVSLVILGRALLAIEVSQIQVPLPKMVTWLALASVLYALANLLVIEAWYRWVHLFSPVRLARGPAYLLYAHTQIARYIPGNVAHIATRHVEARRRGIGHGPLTGAALFELVGLVTAAGLASLPGIGRLALSGLEVAQPNRALLIIAFGGSLAGLGALLILPRTPWASRLGIRLTSRTPRTSILGTLCLYLIFFGVLGGVLYLAAVPFDPPDAGAAFFVAVFAVAWMIGFATPGAPAGMGVREVALLALLQPILGVDAALAFTLCLRLATVSGDLLVFVLSLLARSLRWGATA